MAKILQDSHTPLHNFQISGATRMSHLRKAHQMEISESNPRVCACAGAFNAPLRNATRGVQKIGEWPAPVIPELGDI